MLPQVTKFVPLSCLVCLVFLLLFASPALAGEKPSYVERNLIDKIEAGACLRCLDGYVSEKDFNELVSLMKQVEDSHGALCRKLDVPQSDKVLKLLPAICSGDEKIVIGIADQWRREKEHMRSKYFAPPKQSAANVKAGKRRGKMPSMVESRVFGILAALNRIHAINAEHYKHRRIALHDKWPNESCPNLTLDLAIEAIKSKLRLIELENKTILKSYMD